MPTSAKLRRLKSLLTNEEFALLLCPGLHFVSMRFDAPPLTLLQALLTDPQPMKLISPGLMEYRESVIAPTHLLMFLFGMLF